MSEPVLRTPLGLRAVVFGRRPSAPAVRLEEAPAAVRVGLRASAEDAARIGVALGLDLPGPPLRAVTGELVVALRLGPEEWLLLAADPDPRPILAAIAGAAEGGHVAAVDLGHRFAEILVSGPAAPEVLAAGCPLDLDPRFAPPGFASRTLLGKCEILLHRLGENRFRLLVNRSFAEYCWRFLEHAALEFGTPAPVTRS